MLLTNEHKSTIINKSAVEMYACAQHLENRGRRTSSLKLSYLYSEFWASQSPQGETIPCQKASKQTNKIAKRIEFMLNNFINNKLNQTKTTTEVF